MQPNEHGDDFVEAVNAIVLFFCVTALGILAGWAIFELFL